jgi:uncharacterized protein (DUF2342 family)
VRGTELIDDEIDTTKAYQFFRNLEEMSRDETIRVPERESGGLLAPQITELPSQRLQRLKQELDDLERELQDLEKEEIPTQIKKDPHSAKF